MAVERTLSIIKPDAVKKQVIGKIIGRFEEEGGNVDVEVDGKEQKTLTAPTEPGEYAFHCKYHPSMHGTLIVK